MYIYIKNLKLIIIYFRFSPMQSWEWKCAQTMDGKYISTYGRDKPSEDFAETVLP